LIFTGISLGSIAALVVYHGMRLLGFRAAETDDDRTHEDGQSPAAGVDARDNGAESG